MSNIEVGQALSPEHYPEQGGDEELEYEEREINQFIPKRTNKNFKKSPKTTCFLLT